MTSPLICLSQNILSFMKDAPRGFRFSPSDVEMINSYLIKKNSKMPMEPNPIHQVELYHFSPQQLSGQFSFNSSPFVSFYLFNNVPNKNKE